MSHAVTNFKTKKALKEMFEIRLPDGRWIKVSENIYKMWLGEKKLKKQ